MKSALIPVGMGGVLAGALRTPIAAIVMVMEMTGGYGLIVPLMIVCISSYLVGARRGLIDEQVESAADSPAHAADTVIGLLERARVHQGMRGVWPAVVERATPLARVIAALPAGGAPLAVVLERGRVAGVIAVAELREVLGTDELPEAVIAEDVMATESPVLSPNDSLYEALTLLERSGADALPVVDDADGSFLGVLTRAAVHERVVGDLSHVRDQILREHAGLAAFEEQSLLSSLLSGLPAPDAGAIARVPVDASLVGRSLREVDFRRTRGGVVLAIQTADHRVISPPDPARPLRPTTAWSSSADASRRGRSWNFTSGQFVKFQDRPVREVSRWRCRRGSARWRSSGRSARRRARLPRGRRADPRPRPSCRRRARRSPARAARRRARPCTPRGPRAPRAGSCAHHAVEQRVEVAELGLLIRAERHVRVLRRSAAPSARSAGSWCPG